MAEPVGALRASLSLDSAAFERGVSRANASMGDLGRRINRTTDRMTQFSRQGGKTAAAMAGFGDAMKRAALQIAAATGVIAGVRVSRCAQLNNTPR